MNRERTPARLSRTLTPAMVLSALLVAFPSPAEPARVSVAPVVAAPASAAFPIEPPAIEPPPSEPAPAPSPSAPEPATVWRRLPPLRASAHDVPDRDVASATDADDDASERWMLSVEGITRAPVDAGIQAVLKTPIGLRIGGGYGWMPGPYLNLMSNVLQLALPDEATPRFESGRVLRAQIGLQPFRYFGAYIDAGYARASLEGRLSDDTGPLGRRAFTMELDSWFAELGYQSLIADRLVVAIGIGLTGVIDARTSVDATSADSESASSVAASSNSLIEQYGYLPTLTLRAGFDLI